MCMYVCVCVCEWVCNVCVCVWVCVSVGVVGGSSVDEINTGPPGGAESHHPIKHLSEIRGA